MDEVLDSLSHGDALILTAPPGWGKTYKLLDAIRKTKRKTFFIFPLRALCDEVYLNSLKKKMKVLNIREMKDYDTSCFEYFDLILSTPELVRFSEKLRDYVFIFDEFHLFYYWGDTFRQRMNDIYMELMGSSVSVIFLTATLGRELKSRLVFELELNYENIYQLDMGNQKLQNLPHKVIFYPRLLHSWMQDDYECSQTGEGSSLVFCEFRDEVFEITQKLLSMDYTVLSCIGGGAKEFMEKLQKKSDYDFIVATSVVSHGVNLPSIRQIYLTYNVRNIDFYLQMLGRGGRSGERFNVHVKNKNYFSKKELLFGFIWILLRRVRVKIKLFFRVQRWI